MVGGCCCCVIKLTTKSVFHLLQFDFFDHGEHKCVTKVQNTILILPDCTLFNFLFTFIFYHHTHQTLLNFKFVKFLSFWKQKAIDCNFAKNPQPEMIFCGFLSFFKVVIFLVLLSKYFLSRYTSKKFFKFYKKLNVTNSGISKNITKLSCNKNLMFR